MSRSDVNRCRVWYSGRKPIRRNSTETYSVNTMGFYSHDRVPASFSYPRLN